MIRWLQTPQDFHGIPLPDTHSARKIRSLFAAYGTGYVFCSFYAIGETGMAGILDSSAVLCLPADFDADELGKFLCFRGITACSLDEQSGRLLEPTLGGSYAFQYPYSLEYNGCPMEGAVFPNENPSLQTVHTILRQSFDGMDCAYDLWYGDMSHRIRHGISKAYTYQNLTTLTVQYDLDGCVFLSQIATLPQHRGKGYATALLKSVADAYMAQGKCCILHAEEKNRQFYEQAGFAVTGRSCEMERINETHD